MPETMYDVFAGEWSAARPRPALEVALLFAKLPRQSFQRALDAGCGNGRHLALLSRVAARVDALDESIRLLRLAQQNAEREGVRVFFARDRVQKLPYASNSFDLVLSAAVLHHLRTPRQREAAFSEMARVLRRGGCVIATVWNKRQPRFEEGGVNQCIPFRTSRGECYGRFYHFFESRELRALAKRAGFRVTALFFEKKGAVCPREGAANLCLILQKP